MLGVFYFARLMIKKEVIMIYADLHSHSRYSDGLLDIDELLKLAKSSGLKVLALTDHDKFDHFDLVKVKAQKIGIDLVKGVEMSCYDYDVDKKVHILALFLGDESPHIKEVCDKTLASREENHKDSIKNLQAEGYDIDYPRVKKYSPYSIVFKSNILEYLKERYPDKRDFFTYRNIFGGQKDKTKNRKMGYIDVKKGIEAALLDGAIPFIAHPFLYDNYSQIEKYVGYGLRGIEVRHSRGKEEDFLTSKKFAEQYDLLISGGSDFHDPKKTKFGQYGLSQEDFESLVEGVKKLILENGSSSLYKAASVFKAFTS